MDIADKVNDAIIVLSPLFGEQDYTLKELLVSDPSVVQDIEEVLRKEQALPNWTPCSDLYEIGNRVGHQLLLNHNHDQFDEGRIAPSSMTFFLEHAGAEYAAQCYHAKRCVRRTQHDLHSDNAKNLIQAFLGVWNQVLTSGDKEIDFSATIPAAKAGSILGRLMYEQFGASKLRAYARMTAVEAHRFIKEVAETDLKRN